MAVEQGQKHGYNFTTEEVAQAIAVTQLPAATNGNVELSDQQLEAGAGGKRSDDIYANLNLPSSQQSEAAGGKRGDDIYANLNLPY